MQTMIGLIGLGIMGGAIARNLLEAGAAVVGYDIDPVICSQLEVAGAHIGSSPKSVAQTAQVIFTSLPSAAALDAVISGPGGLAETDGAGRVVVELSTLRIEEKQKAREELTIAGFDLMDAPISGTGKQAITRDISIYASGSVAGYEVVKPIFEQFARSTHYVGDFGNGSRMKFVANLLVAIHNVATAEALTLGMKSGLDPQAMLDILGDGAGSSRMFEIRGPVMVDQTYDDVGMKMDVWQKDLNIIGDFANAAETKTPLFDASVELYEQALAAGYAKQDTAVVCRILEQMASLKR